MGKIIAVVSGKGGTGKTSFTANTGLALASLGQRVLCMDCDITLRNLDLALGLSDRALMDFSDVLAQRCTLEQAVVTHRQYPTLDLLTAPMADKPLPLTVRQLAALAKEIRERYDWCLMDAPAGLGQGFKMAACMADQVIVVTTTDISAMRDAQRTAMELSSFPVNAVHLVVGRVSRKRCGRCIPPSTTPSIPPGCPCWALSRRTRTSPTASIAGWCCGNATTTPPAPTKTSPNASWAARRP